MAPLEDFGAYPAVLERHLAEIVSAGTEVTLHGTSRGSYAGRQPVQVLRFPYARHLIQRQALEACYAAEAEGYDAVTFASFSEPYLTEARALVDIPVVSMPEATLLVGCSLAQRMALITLSARSVPRLRALVAQHGLESRLSGIEYFDPPVTEAELLSVLAAGGVEAFTRRFTDVAQRAIDGGADVIIPAEGVLNEVLYVSGLRGVGDVAVMDGIAVVFAYTELLVQLRQRTGLGVGRAWTYPRPDAELLTALRRSAGLEGGDHGRS
jgi:Asp/Glu/hydantoin racemase